MFTIAVQSDINKLAKQLDGLMDDQVPFATAMALTKTAQDVKEDLVREMKSAFDRPTPYTLNSLRVKSATKRNLEAYVWLKDEFGTGKGTPATKYLLPHIEGTGRRVKRFERWLQAHGILPKGMYTAPSDAVKKDQYGNVTGAVLNQMLTQLKANPDPYQNQTIASRKRAAKRKTAQPKAQYFVGSPGNGKLPLGIYARYKLGHGGSIKPMMFFVGQPKYKKDYRFFEVSEKSIKLNFPQRFREAAQYAMGTRK